MMIGKFVVPVLVALGLWSMLGDFAIARESARSNQSPGTVVSEVIAGEEYPPPGAGEQSVVESAAVEEIVVTGSRIRRNEFSSTAPITIITSETAALAGLLNSADILQGSTIAVGQQIDNTFSGLVTDGGPGARSVSLRGLGEQRTLTLVNGRRWGPSGVRGATNSVDLTALPTSVVSRYEILKDGASSIYGADAIAGVVNVITKKRIDGFQVNVAGGFPEQGGAEEMGFDATWGKVGDDWSFNLSLGYGRTERMTRDGRDWAACDVRPRLTDQDGDGRIDNAHPDTGEPLCFGFVHGFATSPFGWVRYEPSLATPDRNNPYFDPSGPGRFGIPYFTPIPVNGLDPFNDEPLYDNEGAFYRDERNPATDQIIPDTESFSITSLADKDFEIAGRAANAYYEFYYNHRSTRHSSGHRQFFPTVPASNPTNPFGVQGPLASFGGFSAMAVMPTYGLLDPVGRIFIDRINVFAGLAGDISATWAYDTHIGHGWSDGSYEDQQLLADRVGASLNARLDEAGNLVCADNSIPDCVPANLFSEDALLHGRLPRDVLNFLRKDTRGDTTHKTLQFSGHITGTLFEMPSEEPVAAVLGVEYRKEDINDVPDPDARRSNYWGSTTSGITSGNDAVLELFGELEIPLLGDAPLAEEVIVHAAGRWTDYDSHGDNATHRLAVDWRMLPWLRWRATRGTSFRAPDLYEQFLAGQTGFVSGQNDPCISYGEEYEPGDAIYENCAAQGLAPDFGADGAPSIRNIVGGNQELEAETSRSWTAGFVLQPEAPGMSVALSWFDISLKNTVSNPGTFHILNTCYGSAGLSSAWCDRIGARDDTGFLSSINASLVNIGRRVSRGYDVDFLYEREFSTFDLTLDGTITRLMEQSTELFDDHWNSVGNWGYPKWSGEMDIRVDHRDWTAFWRLHFIGDTSEDPVYDPDTNNPDRVVETRKTLYHTASLRWRNNEWDIIASINNVFDKKPPIVGDNVPRDETTRIFNTLPGVGYQIPGRTFVMRIARRF